MFSKYCNVTVFSIEKRWQSVEEIIPRTFQVIMATISRIKLIRLSITIDELQYFINLLLDIMLDTGHSRCRFLGFMWEVFVFPLAVTQPASAFYTIGPEMRRFNGVSKLWRDIHFRWQKWATLFWFEGKQMTDFDTLPFYVVFNAISCGFLWYYW